MEVADGCRIHAVRPGPVVENGLAEARHGERARKPASRGMPGQPKAKAEHTAEIFPKREAC